MWEGRGRASFFSLAEPDGLMIFDLQARRGTDFD